jgi:hypothetical protein
MICDGGSCEEGLDLEVCELKLKRSCKNGILTNYDLLLDDCNGHAAPYHIHKDSVCDYNSSSNSQHSQLIAVALDGRGIYGKWEGNGALPSDLDACNGHFGSVPAFQNGEMSFPSASNVYHYHTSDTPPYTIGCFGPVNSIAECKKLYSTCDVGFATICTPKGEITYDTDCPCYTQGTETYNQNYTFTASCPDNSLKPTTPTAANTSAPSMSASSPSISNSTKPTVATSLNPTLSKAPSLSPTKTSTKSPTKSNSTEDGVVLSNESSHLESAAGKQFVGSIVAYIMIGILLVSLFMYRGLKRKQAPSKTGSTNSNVESANSGIRAYFYRIFMSDTVSSIILIFVFLDTISDIQFSSRLAKESYNGLYAASCIIISLYFSGALILTLSAQKRNASFAKSQAYSRGAFASWVLLLLIPFNLEIARFFPWNSTVDNCINFPSKQFFYVINALISVSTLPQLIMEGYFLSLKGTDYLSVLSIVIGVICLVLVLSRALVFFMFKSEMILQKSPQDVEINTDVAVVAEIEKGDQ